MTYYPPVYATICWGDSSKPELVDVNKPGDYTIEIQGQLLHTWLTRHYHRQSADENTVKCNYKYTVSEQAELERK